MGRAALRPGEGAARWFELASERMSVILPPVTKREGRAWVRQGYFVANPQQNSFLPAGMPGVQGGEGVGPCVPGATSRGAPPPPAAVISVTRGTLMPVAEVWQDREIRFDAPISQLALRAGEAAADSKVARTKRG